MPEAFDNDNLLEEDFQVENLLEEDEWEIKPEILAYLAGIIDGEGCIAIDSYKKSKGNIHHKLVVRCNMMDPQAIELLQLAFPGSHIFVEKTRVYHWGVMSTKAYECLQQLLPYLRVKRYQAAIGMMFQEACIYNRKGSWNITEHERARRDRYREQLQNAKRIRD